jgi:DNA-binding SARP family transcriptional activator/Tfp pilus assembly protein PilF
MQVRLLGPVDVLADGRPRPVPGLRRRAVLAVLALSGGEIVSVDRLADAVWGDDPPSTAPNNLQVHVSQLRKILGDKASIVARPSGYVLDLGSAGTDVQVARRLLQQGTQATDPGRGARHLQAALALWRGSPLQDLDGLAGLGEQAGRLDLLRLQIQRALAGARLAAGEHVQLVPGLELLAAEHPLDEQIRAQLMLALYRSGRQADALAVYHRLRHALDEELGIAPSPMIKDLETAILRHDPALDPPAAKVTRGAALPGVQVPSQLPPTVPTFVGRAAELASLHAILPGTSADCAAPSAVVISAVSGTAGVGKSALAVHWAHQVAARFPDGQLYVNMRGFGPSGQAAEPGEALREFLDALGVPVTRIPAELSAQAGLFRSLLASKRILVVLDNARNVEQVRPLLPGSPGCMAIVTSRSHLTGLVVAEGAVPLTLDLLTTAEARELLASRLGPGRVASEPDAVSDIIVGCARLPLALAIVAARAATQPAFPLAAIASELHVATRALDSFSDDDLTTDARAVFSWSYLALSGGAARLFRLLGLHPGPDIAVPAVASLAGLRVGQARALLTELTRAHLLTEHAPGRYTLHDLLRAYAAEQAQATDRHNARSAALRRLFDHYLQTAHAATMLLDPCVDPIVPVQPGAGVVLGEAAIAEDALSWFTAEHSVLVAAVRLAAQAGLAKHAWQLAWSLTTFLLRRGRWHDQSLVQNIGLSAARHAGDLTGQAHALHALGLGYARSGRFGEARPYFRRALQRFEKLGEHISQARIHSSLTWVAERQKRPAEALSHALRALELYRTSGHRAMEPSALNDVGYCHGLLGNYQQAMTYCQQALAANQELGERSGESATWDSLGYIHYQLGDYRQAVTCYERSLDLCRELADQYNEADTLDHIGDAHSRWGNPDAARAAWSHALRIFDDIDHPDSEHIRAKLRDRDGPPVHADLTLASSIPQAGAVRVNAGPPHCGAATAGAEAHQLFISPPAGQPLHILS